MSECETVHALELPVFMQTHETREQRCLMIQHLDLMINTTLGTDLS